MVLTTVGRLDFQKRTGVDIPPHTFVILGSEIDYRTGWYLPLNFPSCHLKDCIRNLDLKHTRLMKDIQSRASVAMMTSLLLQLLLQMHP